MPLKVVYLDDEPVLCEIFSDLFSSPQIEVKTFTDPSLAIKFINENVPDVIFLDYRLPGTTGDEVAQLLPPAIPKFLITGDTKVDTKYNFAQLFHKPYKEEEIVSAILSVTTQRSKSK